MRVTYQNMSKRVRMVLYTHTMTELRPQNHNRDGLLGPNSTMVVYMDPLGKRFQQGFAGVYVVAFRFRGAFFYDLVGV